jgi:NAD(P)-dependent dehydrogenase (short-subunit alcohol dehydrogenase family)
MIERQVDRPRQAARLGGEEGLEEVFPNLRRQSKAGLLRLTESVADTLAGGDVLVFVMDPGLVRTGMTEISALKRGRPGILADIPRLFEMGVDVPPTLAARSASRSAVADSTSWPVAC